MTVLLACLVRDARSAASYRSAVVLEGTSLLLSLGLLLGLSDLVGADTRLPLGYLSFALVGAAATRVLLASAAAATRLRNEQTTGTLEALLLTPRPAWLLVTGGMTYDLVRAAAVAVAMLGAGVVLTSAEVRVAPAALVLGVAALLGLVVAGGLLLAALTLLVKRTAGIAGAGVSAVALLSGAYYPRQALPDGLEAVAAALPTAWALDALRAGLVAAPLTAGRATALAAAVVLSLPASALLLEAAVRRATATGTLGQY